MKQFLNWTLKHILKTSSTFSGNQLKKEITGTAIGMELPPDHALRVALQDQKSKFEALFERFFNSITGIGWMSNPLMNSDLESGMFFAKSEHVIWIIFPERPMPRLRTCDDDNLDALMDDCAAQARL